jgi:hypothetical protein
MPDVPKELALDEHGQLLAVMDNAGLIQVYVLSAPPPYPGVSAPKPHALTPVELERAWQDLGSSIYLNRMSGMWTLLSGTAEVEAFLKEKLGQPTWPEQAAREAIAGFDSALYAVRETCSRTVRDLGDTARPFLVTALESSSPERRVRASRLLVNLVSPQKIQESLALHILGWRKSTASVEVLKAIAAGPEDHPLVQYARGVLGWKSLTDMQDAAPKGPAPDTGP